MAQALLETLLPGLPPPRRGKVRDVYDLGDRVLLVATDRISAFDAVLSPGIPEKGKILTGLSNFWFRKFADVVPNHLLETDAARFPEPLASSRALLAGREERARGGERLGEARGVGLEEVVRDDVRELPKPEIREPRQDLSFLGNSRAEDGVERGDAVRGDEEDAVSEVVYVAHLAAARRRQTGQEGFEDDVGHRAIVRARAALDFALFPACLLYT